MGRCLTRRWHGSALNANAMAAGVCKPDVVGSASFVVTWTRVCSNGELSGLGGCPGGCFQIVIDERGGVILTTGPKTLLFLVSLVFLLFSAHESSCSWLGCSQIKSVGVGQLRWHGARWMR